MPTAWTKTIDVTSSYTKVTDESTSYSKTTDTDSQWSSFGGLIHLATEGLRKLLMTENNTDYIVVSKGSDGTAYTKVADESTTWTKIADI